MTPSRIGRYQIQRELGTQKLSDSSRLRGEIDAAFATKTRKIAKRFRVRLRLKLGDDEG